jgi:hypothetical protein
MLFCLPIVFLSLAIVDHGGIGAELGITNKYDETYLPDMPDDHPAIASEFIPLDTDPEPEFTAGTDDSYLEGEFAQVSLESSEDAPIITPSTELDIIVDEDLASYESFDSYTADDGTIYHEVIDTHHQQGKFDEASSCKRGTCADQA